MKNKLGSLIAFSLVLLLMFSSSQALAQKNRSFENFAGIYESGREFGGGSVKLSADGAFSRSSGSDDGTMVSSSGYYSYDRGILHFTFAKRTIKFRENKREFNLLDSNDIKDLPYGEDKEEVIKGFDLLPIEWSDRIYIIDEKDLKNFVDAINLGIEPRPCLNSNDYVSPWFGSLYLRKGDEKKKVSGKPNLSDKWLSHLLPKPVSATVIGIQEIKNEKSEAITAFKINKGSKSGLKEEIRLVKKGDTPSPWYGVEVISVTPSTALVRTKQLNDPLSVGDKLSTQYKPEKDFEKLAVFLCR